MFLKLFCSFNIGALLLFLCSNAWILLFTASANGFDGEQLEEHTEEDAKEPSANNEQVEDASHPSSEGVTETAPKEEQSAGDQDTNDTEKVTSVEVSNNDETDGKQDIENHFVGTEDPESDKKPTSRKIDVPNDKVFFSYSSFHFKLKVEGFCDRETWSLLTFPELMSFL